jgi:tyrosyl-tRNA synthetase
LLHGEEEARKAQAAAHALFGGEGEGDIPTTELARERIATGIAVSELFKEAGLVSSSNEARSLIDQGGLSVNGRPVSDARARVDIGMFEDGRLLLSRGRKRHMRVICR